MLNIIVLAVIKYKINTEDSNGPPKISKKIGMENSQFSKPNKLEEEVSNSSCKIWISFVAK